jgi:hypothetical protein
MILGIADSVNGVPIRLTDERWEHILDAYPELASYRETILDTVKELRLYSSQQAWDASRGGSVGTEGFSSCLLR